MTEHSEETSSIVENAMEKIREKLSGHDSSSSSDSDNEKSEESTITSSINRLFGRQKPVHKIFGGGKSADVLLWRNKHISAGVLVGATAIWILFEWIGYHLLTLICHVIILALAGLFVWSNASTFINKSPPHIPEISFSEELFQSIASDLRFELNRFFSILHDVASGRDLKKFLLVVAGLWILSVVGSWLNFLTLFYIVFVFAHTVPVLYEKYEDQVDSFVHKAMDEIKKHYRTFDAKVLSKVLSKVPRGPLKDKRL